MQKRILYVEDEPFLAKVVQESLQNQGFEVELVMDGAEVMSHLASFSPDICVLDIMLPNIDGYALCKHIKRQFPLLPIIFLTAKTETADLVRGFEAGATDYVRKPFSIEELVVRINNQLTIVNASKRLGVSGQERILGCYRYFPMRYELESPTKTIKLSQREQDVLSILTATVNQAVDRKHILNTVWGEDSFFNSRNLDVYIRKLREYFSEDSAIEIVTLKGKGYLFLVK
ncbi:MAG: response regulator transcription factor [Tenuifilaceae bacterium]|jgi:DNA-binding response OmpR family regulator|nr:response regulator transcription factor [Tenuifilaceae bacterium]